MNVRKYRKGNTKWTEKLATQGTQDEEKHSKNKSQHVLDTTMRKQTQKT